MYDLYDAAGNHLGDFGDEDGAVYAMKAIDDGACQSGAYVVCPDGDAVLDAIDYR